MCADASPGFRFRVALTVSVTLGGILVLGACTDSRAPSEPDQLDGSVEVELRAFGDSWPLCRSLVSGRKAVPVGTVCLIVDQSQLSALVSVNPGLDLNTVALAVAPQPAGLPQNKPGALIPGSFQSKTDNIATQTAVLQHRLSDGGVAPGDEAAIAVYASIHSISGSEEGAWATGQRARHGLGQFLQVRVPENSYAAAFIGPSGGEVAAAEGSPLSGVRLEFDPGSYPQLEGVMLQEGSLIEAMQTVAASWGGTVVSRVADVQATDAMPHRPVTVSIPFDADLIPPSASKGDLVVVYADGGRLEGAWEGLYESPPIAFANGEDVARVAVRHFSDLVVVSGESIEARWVDRGSMIESLGCTDDAAVEVRVLDETAETSNNQIAPSPRSGPIIGWVAHSTSSFDYRPGGNVQGLTGAVANLYLEADDLGAHYYIGRKAEQLELRKVSPGPSVLNGASPLRRLYLGDALPPMMVTAKPQLFVEPRARVYRVVAEDLAINHVLSPDSSDRQGNPFPDMSNNSTIGIELLQHTLQDASQEGTACTAGTPGCEASLSPPALGWILDRDRPVGLHFTLGQIASYAELTRNISERLQAEAGSVAFLSHSRIQNGKFDPIGFRTPTSNVDELHLGGCALIDALDRSGDFFDRIQSGVTYTGYDTSILTIDDDGFIQRRAPGKTTVRASLSCADLAPQCGDPTVSCCEDGLSSISDEEDIIIPQDWDIQVLQCETGSPDGVYEFNDPLLFCLFGTEKVGFSRLNLMPPNPQATTPFGTFAGVALGEFATLRLTPQNNDCRVEISASPGAVQIEFSGCTAGPAVFPVIDAPVLLDESISGIVKYASDMVAGGIRTRTLIRRMF